MKHSRTPSTEPGAGRSALRVPRARAPLPARRDPPGVSPLWSTEVWSGATLNRAHAPLGAPPEPRKTRGCSLGDRRGGGARVRWVSERPPTYLLRGGSDQHLQVVATAGVPLQVVHHGQEVGCAAGGLQSERQAVGLGCSAGRGGGPGPGGGRSHAEGQREGCGGRRRGCAQEPLGQQRQQQRPGLRAHARCGARGARPARPVPSGAGGGGGGGGGGAAARCGAAGRARRAPGGRRPLGGAPREEDRGSGRRRRSRSRPSPRRQLEQVGRRCPLWRAAAAPQGPGPSPAAKVTAERWVRRSAPGAPYPLSLVWGRASSPGNSSPEFPRNAPRCYGQRM